MTDRCYLIREGRVFAYGNREQILKNPDVRVTTSVSASTSGHLLDRRRPVSIAHSGLEVGAIPATPTSVSRSRDRRHYQGQFATTDSIHTDSEEFSTQTTQTQTHDPDSQEFDASWFRGQSFLPPE